MQTAELVDRRALTRLFLIAAIPFDHPFDCGKGAMSAHRGHDVVINLSPRTTFIDVLPLTHNLQVRRYLLPRHQLADGHGDEEADDLIATAWLAKELDLGVDGCGQVDFGWLGSFKNDRQLASRSHTQPFLTSPTHLPRTRIPRHPPRSLPCRCSCLRLSMKTSRRRLPPWLSRVALAGWPALSVLPRQTFR